MRSPSFRLFEQDFLFPLLLIHSSPLPALIWALRDISKAIINKTSLFSLSTTDILAYLHLVGFLPPKFNQNDPIGLSFP